MIGRDMKPKEKKAEEITVFFSDLESYQSK